MYKYSVKATTLRDLKSACRLSNCVTMMQNVTPRHRVTLHIHYAGVLYQVKLCHALGTIFLPIVSATIAYRHRVIRNLSLLDILQTIVDSL